MEKKMKKRALTLLEIMIVIFLITLVTGAIGYNMRGTLDKGRAFRTEQAREQLKDLLMICLAEGENADEIAKNPQKFLERQGLAKDPAKLVLDGWNEKFIITTNSTKTDFNVKSRKLISYQNKHKKHESGLEESEED
jgi:type II secretory pathway pseudopilin PulG